MPIEVSARFVEAVLTIAPVFVVQRLPASIRRNRIDHRSHALVYCWEPSRQVKAGHSRPAALDIELKSFALPHAADSVDLAFIQGPSRDRPVLTAMGDVNVQRRGGANKATKDFLHLANAGCSITAFNFAD